MAKEKINLWIEKDQHSKLKVIQKKTGAAVSEQIRRAIDKYLKGLK